MLAARRVAFCSLRAAQLRFHMKTVLRIRNAAFLAEPTRGRLLRCNAPLSSTRQSLLRHGAAVQVRSVVSRGVKSSCEVCALRLTKR
eukprot:scaffold184_cov316-Pinguiococcus_pyrenoidosus.AAC.40